MAVGTVTGTGATINVSLEFTPRRVKVLNVTSADRMEWSSPMPPAAAYKTVAAGTNSYITTLGVTPVEQLKLDDEADPGRGFQIGADTDVNVTDEVIMWVAYE
jgi:hypothetical protein